MSLALRKKIVKTPISKHFCVYCNSDDSTYLGRPGGAFAVYCGVCHARGPVCDGIKAAIDAWDYGVKEEDL